MVNYFDDSFAGIYSKQRSVAISICADVSEWNMFETVSVGMPSFDVFGVYR